MLVVPMQRSQVFFYTKIPKATKYRNEKDEKNEMTVKCEPGTRELDTEDTRQQNKGSVTRLKALHARLSVQKCDLFFLRMNC